MKKIAGLSALFLLLSVSGGTAQTLRVNALSANDYGVTYSLPKTTFVVSFYIKKTVYKRGEFYLYAQRYLGVENPFTEDHTVYTLENVSVENKGVPDKANSFLVSFRPNTLSPYVYLTEDGLICAINAEPEFPAKESHSLPEAKVSSLNARQFLSQETLMAGSTTKQAELVSKQIFDLRRSKNDILTGEAENMPPDGAAYKLVMEQINEQEKALTEMFSGSESTEYFKKEMTFVPDEDNIERRVFARFSEKLGLVDADNLAGEPIYLLLTRKTPKVESAPLTDKERERLEKKFSEGIIYNIPGKALLAIEFKGKSLKSIEADVVQFGSQDVLVKKMFDNMKQPVKVIFYPELGAIKQIVQ
ncbi:MAG: DUF4831 family protein [Dysgonamonadaceae bacterium]|jgi:hypothetical protein|nr:DUF4831 family protein [Dysgonamonadaceae bacterium]